MRIDWTRDEIILACELIQRNDWKGLNDRQPAVVELSRILNMLPLRGNEERDEKFRNPSGVARKTWDIATQHPNYSGKPTKGNRIDREVLIDFLASPEAMKMAAQEIRASILSGEARNLHYEDMQLDVEAAEGRLLLARHFRRERNPQLRSKKIEACKKAGLAVACEVCGFDFEETYGQRGRDYIEVHHVLPLHISGETRTALHDLVLLCANCHRMIHRGRNWLSPKELDDLVVARRRSAGCNVARASDVTNP